MLHTEIWSRPQTLSSVGFCCCEIFKLITFETFNPPRKDFLKEILLSLFDIKQFTNLVSVGVGQEPCKPTEMKASQTPTHRYRCQLRIPKEIWFCMLNEASVQTLFSQTQ